MTTIEKINADYAKAKAAYLDANGWMAAHGGSLIWGLAGLVVGFGVGKLF